MSVIEFQPRGLRVDLVIRTSKRKKDARSPQQQRDMAEACAAAHGYKIVAVHDSMTDESGKTMDRQALRDVMRRKRNGETDGLILGLLDRLGRAPIEEAMTWVRELNAIDGALVPADAGGQPVNLDDPQAETNLVMQLQFARQQWLTTQKRTLKSRQEAVAEGKYVGSAVLGFDKHYGKLVKNGDAPFMREVILAAAGPRKLAAAQEMLAARWPRGRWDADRVRKLLGSPAYKGWSVSGDLVNRDAHTGIVSETEWKAAQHEAGPRRPNGDYPLSGIATCECGAPMVGQLKTVPGRARQYRTLRCSATAHLSISADSVETHVREWLRPLVTGGYFDVQFGDANLAAAEAALKLARDERAELGNDRELRRRLGTKGYSNLAADLAAAEEEAEAAYQEAVDQSSRASWTTPSEADLDTPEGLADAARLAVAIVPIVVTAGRGPIERRVTLPVLDDRAGVLAA